MDCKFGPLYPSLVKRRGLGGERGRRGEGGGGEGGWLGICLSEHVSVAFAQVLSLTPVTDNMTPFFKLAILKKSNDRHEI